MLSYKKISLISILTIRKKIKILKILTQNLTVLETSLVVTAEFHCYTRQPLSTSLPKNQLLATCANYITLQIFNVA